MAWRWGLAAALVLAGGAFAQEAPRGCPAGATCTSVGSAVLGPAVSWQFYDVRTQGERYGLSVLVTPKGEAAMRTDLDAVARWRRGSYPVAGLVTHGGVEYAGMAVRGGDGALSLDLYRLDDGALTRIDTSALPAEVSGKVAALTRRGCTVSTGGVDWRTFRIRHGLISDEGSCGTVLLDLAVENGRVKVADAMAFR